MNSFKEIDAVRIKRPIEAWVFGDPNRYIFFPEGSEGTVVFVYGDEANPIAYEVEFSINEPLGTALATLKANEVEAAGA